MTLDSIFSPYDNASFITHIYLRPVDSVHIREVPQYTKREGGPILPELGGGVQLFGGCEAIQEQTTCSWLPSSWQACHNMLSGCYMGASRGQGERIMDWAWGYTWVWRGVNRGTINMNVGFIHDLFQATEQASSLVFSLSPSCVMLGFKPHSQPHKKTEQEKQGERERELQSHMQFLEQASLHYASVNKC